MSFQETFLIMSLMIFMLVMSWKWYKSLMIILLLEGSMAMVLSLILVSSSSHSIGLIALLIFLVSESLILLSSLYMNLRIVGTTHSELTNS